MDRVASAERVADAIGAERRGGGGAGGGCQAGGREQKGSIIAVMRPVGCAGVRGSSSEAGKIGSRRVAGWHLGSQRDVGANASRRLAVAYIDGLWSRLSWLRKRVVEILVVVGSPP